MVLELYTPTRADVPETIQLGYDGYSDDIVTPLMYAVPVSAEQLAASTDGALEHYGTDPHATILAVKNTDTGRIVSLAEWNLVPEPSNDDWNVYKPRPPMPGWNNEYFQYASKLAWQDKIDAMGKQPYIYLSTLVTPPAHRKQGAASLLMKALLEYQAQVNLPIYLVASPIGLPLYTKFGFKEISRFELDISAVDSKQKRWHVGMLLPAPSPDMPPSLPQYTPVNKSADSSSVEIRPLASLAEHMAMREIRDRAFGPNEMMELCFSGQESEGTPESRAGLSFNDAEADPRHKWIGAFDPETRTLLGVSHWYFADDPNVEHFPHGTQGWMPGTNIPLAEAHFGTIKRHRLEMMKGKRYAYLCLLIVDVNVQGKGIGRRLLEYTLEEIDELGWESWIEATPAGLGLYLRLGWEVVGTVKTDLKQWGGKGCGDDAEMIRKPKLKS